MTSLSSSAGWWHLPRLRRGVGRPEGTKARLRPSINPTQVLMPQEVDRIAIFAKVFRNISFLKQRCLRQSPCRGTAAASWCHPGRQQATPRAARQGSYRRWASLPITSCHRSRQTTQNCPGLVAMRPALQPMTLRSLPPPEDSPPTFMATVAVYEKPL